jgi:uncharacterized membrane protein YphA (DoxX/SURF4 family)
MPSRHAAPDRRPLSVASRRRNLTMNSYRKLSWYAVVLLVALRFSVGWHFYMEGASKVRDGKFSSVGFLQAAKGPLASQFQALIPDQDGAIRLDRDKMAQVIGDYVAQASTYYRFENKQEAEKLANKAIDQIDSIYAQWSKDIQDYQNSRKRIAALEKDPKRTEIASLRDQKEKVESDWKALVRPALGSIDKTTRGLETQLHQLAGGKPPLAFRLPGESAVSTRWVDKFIPIFDMSVGILLILGLLTPLAGFAGGLFLLSVVLTQWPGSLGATPTYYQAIEMFACFFLAAADAGRYWGLDFIPWTWWKNRKIGGWETD